MAMKINKILLTVLLFILLIFNYGFAKDDGQIYSTAIREAESGNIDFAFMYFRNPLNYRQTKAGMFSV